MSKSPAMDASKSRAVTMTGNKHNVNHVHISHLLHQRETCTPITIKIKVLNHLTPTYKTIGIYDTSGLGDIRFVSYYELFDNSNLVHRDQFGRVVLEITPVVRLFSTSGYQRGRDTRYSRVR